MIFMAKTGLFAKLTNILLETFQVTAKSIYGIWHAVVTAMYHILATKKELSWIKTVLQKYHYSIYI